MKTSEFSYLLRNTSASTKKITKRADDFPAWYQDIISGADLAENGPSKGSMIIKPYGYAIWQNIQNVLDAKIRELGVPNMYFPMFIPEHLLHKEAKHIEGFAPEVAVVTHAGGKELQDKLIVRPTSETIMYDSFSRWIQSYRDLPLLINQWANVVRWELRPRLFLRTTEFLWQEGHTAHATQQEADDFAKAALQKYREVAEDLLAIAVYRGEKSESERFAGAKHTYTLEPIMQDGKALQFATSHNLGDNFSKAFDITYSDENEKQMHVWQTSWGLSTRTVGALIMAHSDDNGLVLPPNVAPLQVVITTVGPASEEVVKAANNLSETIEQSNLVDERAISPGEKFFYFEKRGVPIRIEIGPRDVEAGNVVLVLRDTGEKKTVATADVANVVTKELETMQKRMYDKSTSFRDGNTASCKTLDEAIAAANDGKFALVDFEVDESAEKALKAHAITIRAHLFEPKGSTILAKSY